MTGGQKRMSLKLEDKQPIRSSKVMRKKNIPDNFYLFMNKYLFMYRTDIIADNVIWKRTRQNDRYGGKTRACLFARIKRIAN